MSKLNKDILFLLFEELQSDSKSLFSCLLVNRLWCETAIPILWKNPWNYDINYKNKSYLFAIIAFYLPISIKEFLMRQGINFPPILYQSLLFNYLSFCRGINVTIINSIIPIGSSLKYNQFLLQQEFYNLLIKTCPELKYLDMKSINHQIFYFPEAKAHLETLYELDCNTSDNPTYFYGLARICQNIQRLVIINNTIKVNYGIAKLIEVQESLKNFEWKDDFIDDYFVEDPYKETLLALEKKADTLNHLKVFFLYGFEHAYELLKEVLPKLNKLKTLIIDELFFFPLFAKNQLIYPYIEVLYVDFITINVVSSIIENSGGHLKEILLFKFYDYSFEENFNEDSLNFIRKICEHCPLIEYLTLTFSPTKEHFTEFEKLLNVCQNLKLLILDMLDIDNIVTSGEILENGEELLKTLIRTAPANLKEIRLFDYYKISLQVLEEFFKEWRGRPALSILTNDTIYRGEDYMKLVNEYKSDGVIKDFRFVSRNEMY
ncbi:hypothetical protein C1645_834883 [Glomus cerebriforme]|uniref:F-box domain-containing protein n=1 Tax=Glomus cerebriforme TaxID=658196 RepID=A0A397S8T4_9GLOM|nr:hypothetical protein C1645_834883 [Glomus cerebriforme]